MRPPFLPDARDVLTKPEEFFKKDVERIKRWAQPITYLFFLTLIGAFFISDRVKYLLKQLTQRAIDELGLQGALAGYTPSALGIAGLFLLLVIVLLLATSFKYWVAHLYVRLWNKKATFKKTYVILTYGGTPGWLAMPFSALFIYFLYKSLITGGTANWLLTIFSLTVWAGLEGYSIYLRIYALARIQGITKWQAVLAVYVLGLITYLVGVMIIEFIIIFAVLLVLAAIGVMPIGA